MQSDDTVYVETTKVCCDGGEGSLGHPAVYLTIKPSEGQATCPYCSKRFVLAEGAKTGTDH